MSVASLWPLKMKNKLRDITEQYKENKVEDNWKSVISALKNWILSHIHKVPFLTVDLPAEHSVWKILIQLHSTKYPECLLCADLSEEL